jgi:hypothetical protein
MLGRWIWVAGSLLFAASACSSNPPARSAAPGPKSETPRAAGSEGANPQPLPNELPPAVGKMLDDQPCQQRLITSPDQHISKATGPNGSHPFLIAVGEKLCLVGDSPGALKLAEGSAPLPAQGPKWISAEFQVLDMGSVLVIRNHFDRPLRYRAVIKAANRSPEATSVCPIRANLASLEHWPYPIEFIAFGDFAPVQPGEPGDCR